MKKCLSLFLAMILLFDVSAYALSIETTSSVENVAVELLNDAIAQPDAFSLPDLS